MRRDVLHGGGDSGRYAFNGDLPFSAVTQIMALA